MPASSMPIKAGSCEKSCSRSVSISKLLLVEKLNSRLALVEARVITSNSFGREIPFA